MPLDVARDALGELRYELRTLGPRTDHAHLAVQHVEQLRQLIDPGLSDERADAGDAGVALLGPARLFFT